MFICLGWATTQPLHLNLKSLCVFTMCCAILQAMLQNVPANGRYGQSPCTSGSFCISWTWCPSSWELGLMSSNDWTVPDIMHEGSLRIPFRKELRSFSTSSNWRELLHATATMSCKLYAIMDSPIEREREWDERILQFLCITSKSKSPRWLQTHTLSHHPYLQYLYLQ